MNKPLQDANVLVTGGSSETGPFICEAFAEAGANVATTYFSNEAGGQKTLEAVEKAGGKGWLYKLDLHSQASIDELISSLREDVQRLDVVILNAGSKGLRPFSDLTRQQLDIALDGNVKGNFMLAKELGYDMKRSRGMGRLIQVTAQSAENASHSAYGMAKAAQRDMAEFLAFNLAPEVTVNTIQPIGIDQDPGSDYPPEDEGPLGRQVHAREIARMAVLMCDPAFDTVTGEVIRMDGGRHIQPAIVRQNSQL